MKGEHPIRMLCELLKISHSGYYRWCQQRPSARQREDAEWQDVLPDRQVEQEVLDLIDAP